MGERGVYAIRNLVTGQAYVGSSGNVEQRWARHRGQLAAGKHPNERLQRAWAKYGAPAFAWALVEPVPEGDLYEPEQRHIDGERDPYNLIAAGAPPSFRGGRHTEEAKALMRAARLGKVMSPESRALVAAAARGRRQPAESIERSRQANLGRVRTPEQRQRYRDAWTPERSARHSRLVSKLTEEQRQEIRSRYPSESLRALGARFGVSHSAIRAVVKA